MTATPRRNRPRVPRAEGEHRLVQATIELAREQAAGDFSAREIARRADINHGYVHVWFGSKAGLLAAAVDQLGIDLGPRLRQIAGTTNMFRHPDLVAMCRLLAHLQGEPGGVEMADGRDRPLVDFWTTHARSVFGLDETSARSVAELGVATLVGIVLAGDVLGLNVPNIVSTWARMVPRLAAPRG